MSEETDMSGTEASLPHHNRLENELRGSWNVMAGKAEMLTGAQFADPELFFNGVVDAMQGDLEQAIGDGQAQVASDALRAQWSGLSQETKGEILSQWGKWTDDPQALANGVVDLMQGRVKQDVGSATREAGKTVGDATIALSDADAASA